MFEASEVINAAVNHDGVPSPFPFLQSDLYHVTQPGRLCIAMADMLVGRVRIIHKSVNTQETFVYTLPGIIGSKMFKS